MSNSLRIVYDNKVDLANTTLTASSTATAATAVANLALDSKSKIWRSSTCSTSSVKVLLKVVLASTVVQAVVLPFTNLTTAATIRVYGYTGTVPTLTGTVDSPTFTAGGTLAFDTGAGTLACPYQSFNVWSPSVLPIGANTYAFGGGTYARIYIPVNIQAACTSMIIEIDDVITDKYIEAARLIIGPYWSPTYNTSYGLSYTPKDTTTHLRTESGDLLSNRGPRFGSMTFDLKYMNTADRSMLYSILRGNGLPRPMFVSLFPENSDDWDLEQQFQLYGKLSQLSSLQYVNFIQYSSQIDMEEI